MSLSIRYPDEAILVDVSNKDLLASNLGAESNQIDMTFPNDEAFIVFRKNFRLFTMILKSDKNKFYDRDRSSFAFMNLIN